MHFHSFLPSPHYNRIASPIGYIESLRLPKQSAVNQHVLARAALVRLLVSSTIEASIHLGTSVTKTAVGVIELPLYPFCKCITPRKRFVEVGMHLMRVAKLALAILTIPLLGFAKPEWPIRYYRQLSLVDMPKGVFGSAIDYIRKAALTAWSSPARNRILGTALTITALASGCAYLFLRPRVSNWMSFIANWKNTFILAAGACGCITLFCVGKFMLSRPGTPTSRPTITPQASPRSRSTQPAPVIPEVRDVLNEMVTLVENRISLQNIFSAIPQPPSEDSVFDQFDFCLQGFEPISDWPDHDPTSTFTVHSENESDDECPSPSFVATSSLSEPVGGEGNEEAVVTPRQQQTQQNVNPPPPRQESEQSYPLIPYYQPAFIFPPHPGPTGSTQPRFEVSQEQPMPSSPPSTPRGNVPTPPTPKYDPNFGGEIKQEHPLTPFVLDQPPAIIPRSPVKYSDMAARASGIGGAVTVALGCLAFGAAAPAILTAGVVAGGVSFIGAHMTASFSRSKVTSAIGNAVEAALSTESQRPDEKKNYYLITFLRALGEKTQNTLAKEIGTSVRAACEGILNDFDERIEPTSPTVGTIEGSLAHVNSDIVKNILIAITLLQSDDDIDMDQFAIPENALKAFPKARTAFKTVIQKLLNDTIVQNVPFSPKFTQQHASRLTTHLTDVVMPIIENRILNEVTTVVGKWQRRGRGLRKLANFVVGS